MAATHDTVTTGGAQRLPDAGTERAMTAAEAVLALNAAARLRPDCDFERHALATLRRLFQSRMGADLALLDSYFSCIVCCQLPNLKTARTDASGGVTPGSALYNEQIMKIKVSLRVAT